MGIRQKILENTMAESLLRYMDKALEWAQNVKILSSKWYWLRSQMCSCNFNSWEVSGQAGGRLETQTYLWHNSVTVRWSPSKGSWGCNHQFEVKNLGAGALGGWCRSATDIPGERETCPCTEKETPLCRLFSPNLLLIKHRARPAPNRTVSITC